MSAPQRPRRLAPQAGCASVTLGLALAQAGGLLPVVDRHAALSWGLNGIGQLGRGNFIQDIATPGAVSGLGTGVIAVSAGGRHSLAPGR